ncbi:hypothetical protein [Psychrobacter celer]|uniref:hypothetical protein n=1 Tax=Psychrobacter celer TaxID=306572 RepID=UPI003FCF342B
MSIIKIQISHTRNITKEDLASHLYNEIGEEYDISEDDIEDYFEIEYVLQLPNGSFVTVFTLDFPTLAVRDLELKDILKSYLDTLNNLKEITSIVKLKDDLLKKVALEYYEKLFDIEMELRNVLTYVLLYDDKSIDKEIFRNFGVKSPALDKSQESEIKENYENPFFYVLFNHYASFNEPAPLETKDIAAMLQDVSLSDFSQFKQKLERRKLDEERHKDFLASLNNRIKPLEDFRNCIMHARNISNKKIDNFDKAINDNNGDKGIFTIINDFWLNENTILSEKTWLSLARKELSIYSIDDMIADDENEFDDREEVIDHIIDEINSNIDISDFEPSDENIDELRSLIDP